MMFFPVDSFHIALKDVKKQRQDVDEDASTVRRLLRYVEPVFTQARCVEVLDHFIRNEDLPAVAIVDQHHTPVGIMDRGRISEIFLRPFSRDLLHNKRITEIMDAKPIIVDINAGIDDVSQIIIDSGMRHMVNGFIVLDEGVYAGMATGHALLEEITHRRQRDLYILAHYDQLTGLPNRLLFNDRLQQACQNAQRNNKILALIFVDLDRFKYINDTFGHALGDILLRQIADQFKNVMSAGRQGAPMFIARFGGDEFVIVEDFAEGDELLQTAERLLALLDRSFTIDGHDFHVNGSIGISVFPFDGATPEDLIKNADAAMYKAKREGKNNIQFYSADLATEMSEFYNIEQQLKLAVERDEFLLHYQPQIDLASGRVVAVEALVRWNSPERGLVPPLQFIPVAEEVGLIREIGEMVVRKACAQWRIWSDQGIEVKMAVNVSPVQFRDDAFTSQLEKLLEEARMPSRYLEIEITEGVLVGNMKKALAKLHVLSDMGVSIAIDDFGTGYSSLEYLKDLPINCLKIDGSFVREIRPGSRDLAIVRTIEALGRNLQMVTVAEGIEEGEQYDLLKNIGCTLGQGYFISRPGTADELEALLRNGSVPDA